ncbi:MAG: hypothetical protein ACRC1T_05490 [Clostridium chrysemydis]|uniref:hypothetical protein n=1 Tax=Clostridium chrysemydis TaxID=2665504 RepID=UPI003F3C5B7C
MNIKRETFEECKQGIWLIGLKKDKYLHIPKPKTTIIYLFRFIKGVLTIPIGLVYLICESLIEALEDLPRFISSDIIDPFRLMFPNIVNVIDEGRQWVEDVEMLENDK